MTSTDSFGARGTIQAGGAEHEIYRLSAVEGADRLPFSLKILLENLLRTEDGANVTADHVRALANWDPTADPDTANVLVMPAFHSASISTKMLKELGGATVIGPMLVGLSKPVQIVSLGARDSDIVNMAALAAYDITGG